MCDVHVAQISIFTAVLSKSVEVGIVMIVIYDETCHWGMKYNQHVLSATTNKG